MVLYVFQLMHTFRSLVFRFTGGTLNEKDKSQISKYRKYLFFIDRKAGGDGHNFRTMEFKISKHKCIVNLFIYIL